jgi:hypothetical protein
MECVRKHLRGGHRKTHTGWGSQRSECFGRTSSLSRMWA